MHLLGNRSGSLPILEVLANSVGPPGGLGRDEPNLSAPLRTGHARARDAAEPDVALVPVEIGDRAQQQRLSGSGGTSQRDDLAIGDGDVTALQNSRSQTLRD